MSLTFSSTNLNLLPTATGYYEIPIMVDYDYPDETHQPKIVYVRSYAFNGSSATIPSSGGLKELIESINDGLENGVSVKIVNGSGVFVPTSACTIAPNSRYNNYSSLFFHGAISFKYQPSSTGPVTFTDNDLMTFNGSGDLPILLVNTITSPLALVWGQSEYTAFDTGLCVNNSSSIPVSAGSVRLYTAERNDSSVAKVYGYSSAPSMTTIGSNSLLYGFFSEDKGSAQYMISVSSSSNGTASASSDYASSGTAVTVTFTPDSGYSVDWANASITSTVAVALVQTSDTTATFTMPAANVTINPAFVQALTAGVTVSGGHGTATISNEHPAQGDTVTITCYPDSGYEVDTVTSFDATISKVATNQYQFTMPNVDVLATVTFKETPFFNVTVEATPNGTVSASPSSGYSGTTITLTVAPNAGYNLQRLYVLAGTDTVPVTKVDDTHYTFVLPSFNVVVRAKFWDGDPYSPGGNSEPSEPGGTGSFDNTTTPITPPAIPSVSVQDTGLYTIFSLTQEQLNDFTNYLWSNLFSLPTVTKYLNNATDNILSLHILPFNVDAGSAREIKFMGVGTGANGLVVTNQHQHINCGSILLEEYYGSAMDYNPWTKIKVYIPYCGEIDLDPDEVMNKTLA